ncbi:MAG: AMP-binding protein [Chloroflexi bacterium]|nr:AMP-binding protein [Chloroflexota bacterium]
MIDIVGRRTLGSVLAHHASSAPDRPFLIFEDAAGTVTMWTYAAFDRLVNQTAQALASLGIGHGDTFNLHLPNCPEFIALWFAAARLGAIMTPTNVALTADELTYIVDHSESQVIITDAERLPIAAVVRGRLPAIRHLLVTGDAPAATAASLGPLVAAAPATPPAATASSDDVAALLYTSGTTANPKGCLVTQAAYLYAGECMAKGTRGGPTDRHLVVLPLFHAGAQTHSVMPALVSGAGVALMHRFSASRFFAQAARHGCTLSDLFAAPIRMILRQPAADADRQTPLRLLTFAQNIAPAEVEAWRARCGVPLMQLWGMTETVGLPLMNPLDDARDPMTLGLPVLGYQVRVVDEESGAEVGPGEQGQLLVAGVPGRTLMRGYFKDPAATARTLRDGWLHTGDVVAVGDDGQLSFVDRAKDLIKRSGVNIAASEVEAALKAHPAVFDAAVVGIPDPIRDEAIVAFVIAREGASVTPADLTAWCAERLAAFKRPERIAIVAEFPRTPVGKIQKHLLRTRATAGEG